MLATPDGELEYIADFIPADRADVLFDRLREELAWHEEDIAIAGRTIRVPRLVCWYGDPGAHYRYSGTGHDPLPWTDLLNLLKLEVEQRSGRRFNSVLGTLYRDGNDSLGWHADKERELGPEPCIASLSFGAERRFELRHNNSREAVGLTLGHGSLLFMGGSLQRHWRHRVPKVPAVRSPRINLTFRLIFSPFT
jgi:alkylated DNA repair dioxygenase AlkB